MKKNIFFAVGTVLVAGALLTFVYVTNEKNSMSDLFHDNVEVLASCEIKNKKGEIIYACVGEEGQCQPDPVLGHTLICSGTEVTK